MSKSAFLKSDVLIPARAAIHLAYNLTWKCENARKRRQLKWLSENSIPLWNSILYLHPSKCNFVCKLYSRVLTSLHYKSWNCSLSSLSLSHPPSHSQGFFSTSVYTLSLSLSHSVIFSCSTCRSFPLGTSLAWKRVTHGQTDRQTVSLTFRYSTSLTPFSIFSVNLYSCVGTMLFPNFIAGLSTYHSVFLSFFPPATSYTKLWFKSCTRQGRRKSFLSLKWSPDVFLNIA